MSEYPSQYKNRAWWIVSVIRNHQALVADMIDTLLSEGHSGVERINELLGELNVMDRDALLQRGGIFNNAQLDSLTETKEEARVNQAELREDR